MRYQQSKDHSSELLRMVMAQMSRHDAAYNPVTFTVWYEHTAGMNSHLSQAIETLLQTSPRLSDDDIWHLYQSYVADVDPQAMHRIGNQLHQTMQGMADTASRTVNQADEFGVQLQGLSDVLSTKDTSRIGNVIERVTDGAARMQSAVHALAQVVQTSHLEINRLQGELIRVRDESVMDTLTQVLNRKGFDQKLAAMLATAPKPGRHHGLIMLDLDHFKQVNDTYGHVMGDRVLQAFGEVLRTCVPVQGGNSAARYGGEEFAVLMPDTSPQAALKMAEIIRLHTKAMKVRDRRTQSIVLTATLSGGVALQGPDDDALALVARADDALYQSKHAGRDRITCAFEVVDSPFTPPDTSRSQPVQHPVDDIR